LLDQMYSLLRYRGNFKIEDGYCCDCKSNVIEH
jgi:hypothetical protein